MDQAQRESLIDNDRTQLPLHCLTIQQCVSSCDFRHSLPRSGGVENVVVDNVYFKRANGAAHIKTGQSRGGYVKNVVFSNLVAEGPLDAGILVDAFYGSRNPSCPTSWNPKPPVMSNYTFQGIDGTKGVISKRGKAFHLVGLPTEPITGVTIKDVKFQAGSGWDCTAVSGTADKGSVTPWPPCSQITPVAV